MVFRSVSDGEEMMPEKTDAMLSSASVKSQSLHNFSLPDLKWSFNLRKFVESGNKESEEVVVRCGSGGLKIDSELEDRRKSAVSEGTVDGVLIEKSVMEVAVSEKNLMVSVENVEAVAAIEGSLVEKVTVSDPPVKIPEKNLMISVKNVEASREGKSKILLRIRPKSKPDTVSAVEAGDQVVEAGEQAVEAGDQAVVVVNEEESPPKTWNLRPRKLVVKRSKAKKNANGQSLKIGGSVQETKPQERSQMESNQSQSVVEARVTEKVKPKQKEKQKQKPKLKFSLSLTKEEIEEDIYSLTGSRPSRRPKKRAKNVQKQLDLCFPALWSDTVSIDTYRVPATPIKLIR